MAFGCSCADSGPTGRVPRDRQIRHRSALAPCRLPTLLDVKKSATTPGRPCVAPEIRELIRNMCRANPLWGAPRVHGELAKLGISISQTAVSKYIIRRRKPPSQTWRSFLGSCRGLGVHRLLHVADRHLPDSVRFHHSPSRSPAHRPFQCHGASFGRVDRAADRRCLCVGYGAALHAARPGWNLRAVLQTARCGTRYRAGSGAALPVAEPVVSKNKNELKTRVSRGVLNGRFYASFAKNTSRIRAFGAVRVFGQDAEDSRRQAWSICLMSSFTHDAAEATSPTTSRPSASSRYRLAQPSRTVTVGGHGCR